MEKTGKTGNLTLGRFDQKDGNDFPNHPPDSLIFGTSPFIFGNFLFKIRSAPEVHLLYFF